MRTLLALLTLPVLLVTADRVDAALVVRVPPALVVEHPKNTATGVIHLHNPSTTAAPVYLTADDFVATSTGVQLGTGVVFSGPGGTARGSVYEGSIPAGGSLAITVDVSNLWEAGEALARLWNRDREVGFLRTLKYRVPLGVRILDAGEPPMLAFQRGVSRTVTLKNDDAMTYDLDWRLAIGGGVAQDHVLLPANRIATITVAPKPEWCSASLEGVFKDETKDGTLTLRFAPRGQTAVPYMPEQSIPVRAQLAYWPAWRHPVSMLVVFLALLAGGLCSLLLNQWFPNRLRRLDLEERLADAATRTRNLSSRVDSGLRILVRVERYRLLRLLNSRYAFSPEMARVLAACSEAADRLTAKITLLEQIDTVDGDVRRLQLVAAPTLADAVAARLRKATDRLRSPQPTDAEMHEAGALVAEAAAKLAAISQADAELVSALQGRLEALEAELGASSPLRKSAQSQTLAAQLRALFDYLDGPPQLAGLRPTEYFDHDVKLLRLALVHEYLRLYADVDQAARSRLDGKSGKRFAEHIASPAWDSYVEARLVLREIRDNIDTHEVEEQIRKKQARIVAQPADPRPHQAVELSAVFTVDTFNRSSARDEYVCQWTFEHVDSDGRPTKWLETGWSVQHFFPKPGSYKAKATFQRKDGSLVADQTNMVTVIDADVTVGSDNQAWFGNRTWIEVVRFGIVLVATILGLLGGAREQLMRLDVLAGLVAVFLIGFGADAVKNILVDRGTTGTKTPA